MNKANGIWKTPSNTFIGHLHEKMAIFCAIMLHLFQEASTIYRISYGLKQFCLGQQDSPKSFKCISRY